jgi:type II secretory pathway predicted ATPase ExeA
MMTMRNEVMEFYGLKRSLRSAGYFLTTHHHDLLNEVKQAIYDGTLIVLSGVIGAGKTAALTQLQERLLEEDRIVVSTAVSVEKNRVALGTLITALFCDPPRRRSPGSRSRANCATAPCEPW